MNSWGGAFAESRKLQVPAAAMLHSPGDSLADEYYIIKVYHPLQLGGVAIAHAIAISVTCTFLSVNIWDGVNLRRVFCSPIRACASSTTHTVGLAHTPSGMDEINSFSRSHQANPRSTTRASTATWRRAMRAVCGRTSRSL